MLHEELTGVERRMNRKYTPHEQVDYKCIMAKPVDGDDVLKNNAELVKDWIATGEDQYKAKFDSVIHVRCLNNYLKDNEIVNLKDYKMSVNKKEKEITITRNAKVQKVETDATVKP